MSDPAPQPTPQFPNLGEELRRFWDWVVFTVNLLRRLGGPAAWLRALQRLAGLLLSRRQPQTSPVLTIPELGAQRTFYPSDEFPFANRLETNWQIILRELENLQGKHFIPWSEKYLYKEGWSTFGLYAFGLKIEKNCALCPQTTRLVEEIPNLITAGFSALAPGTHIAPHTGYPDGVLRCHLGLVVPENCGIRVNQEIQTWSEGRCLIFDDTLEHEAWNRSDKTRVVMLIDFKP